MSFSPGYGGQRFQEKLKHEDHIHNQIEACRQTFNEGDKTEIQNMVESLLLLVTPKMEDDEFNEDLQKLDQKWEEQKKIDLLRYRRELLAAGSGCPDLVSRPSTKPGIEHWKEAYMIALALFERRGLMLKVDTEDDV